MDCYIIKNIIKILLKIKNGFKFEKYNINVFNDVDQVNNILLKADSNSHKITVMKILNLIKSLWNSINLVEQTNTRYEMQFEDVKFKDILYEKSLENVNFRTLTLINQSYSNNYYYYVLCNSFIYIVLKINVNDENDVNIYDIGPFVELTLQQKHEIIYEISIPESKMLLGLNFYIKY